MLKQTFDQSPTRNKILQVHRLKKHFHIGRGLTLQAVNDITFHVNQGETFGLVGESGCGKSTIGRTIMGLYDKTSGDVYYDRSEEHTSELQSRFDLVCRLLLEKYLYNLVLHSFPTRRSSDLRLKKHFHIGRGLTLQAVNDITFHVNQGETFGLVGESGCGKSTIGRTIMGLYDKTSGDVYYD